MNKISTLILFSFFSLFVTMSLQAEVPSSSTAQYEEFELPKSYLYSDVTWDKKGQAHMVFLPSKKNRKAYYSFRNLEGKWSKPKLASNHLKMVFGMGIGGPKISVSDKGTIHILMTSAGQLYDARSTNKGKKFKLISLRQGAPKGTFGGAMATTAEGGVYSAWVDTRNTVKYRETQEVGAGDIYFTYSKNDGKKFSKPIKISDVTPCVCCPPNIVVHGDTIVVAYRSTLKAYKEIRVVTSFDGGETWSKGVQISDDDFLFKGCLEMQPNMSIDPSGKNIIVMWNSKKTFRAAISTDGGKTFGKPEHVNEGVTFPIQLQWSPVKASWVVIPVRKNTSQGVLIDPQKNEFSSYIYNKESSFYRLLPGSKTPIVLTKPN